MLPAIVHDRIPHRHSRDAPLAPVFSSRTTYLVISRFDGRAARVRPRALSTGIVMSWPLEITGATRDIVRERSFRTAEARRCRVSPPKEEEERLRSDRDCEAGPTCAVLRVADVMPGIASARISTRTAYFDLDGPFGLGLRQLRFAYYARPGGALHLHNVRDKCAASNM